MTNGWTANVAGKLPLLLGAAGLAFGIPSASLAVVSLTNPSSNISQDARAVFTPASVDPKLARRVAEQVRKRGFRFTPTNAQTIGDRTVTVAVRVNGETAKAISVRSSIAKSETSPGKRSSIASIEPTRYDLGIARGYKSFARPIVPAPARVTTRVGTRAITLPDSVRKLDAPDLSSFKPGKSDRADKPSRFKPRIELADKGKAGRAEGTLQGQGTQSLDVGGSYRVARNLDVTAGVRISQENDRLAPLADTVQDNQAVYVGTQFKF